MSVVVRRYQPGDAEGILRLFQKNSPYQRDQSFWVWINRILSGYPSITVVAEEDGVVIGNNTVVPHDILINGRMIRCGMSIHTILDKEYQSSGYILDLFRLTNELAKENGMAFVWGFPNELARPVNVRFNKFQKVSLFNALEAESSIFSSFSRSTNVALKKIDSADYSFLFALNEVIEKRSKSCVELFRSLDYYRRRYFEHPQKLYECYQIEAGGVFAGLLVLKFYKKNDLLYLHIIDCVCSDGVSSIDLITAIINHFKDLCDIFSFWKVDSRLEAAFKQIGFQEKGFDTFLGFRMIDDESMSQEEVDLLLNFDNWRLVMGDSDAF